MEAPRLVCETRWTRGELACLDAAGGRLAGGGGRGALQVWEWGGATGAGWVLRAEEAHAHRYGVTAARWAAGGALLASGGVDGAVRVWALREGPGQGLACRHELAGVGAAAVRALCWGGAGAGALAAGHDDGALRVWRVRGGALLARLAAPHAGALHALAALADGALLAAACTLGTLKVYDLVALCSRAEAEVEAKVEPLVWIDEAHDLGALCAEAAPRGAGLLATGGHDARVRLWRVAGERGTLRDAGLLVGHTGAVTALRWAEEPGRGGGGERAVLGSASLDRSARLWALRERGGVCLLVLAAHPRYLTCIALAPDLRYMITGSNDRTFRTWSLGEFSLEAAMRPPCNALAHFALGDLEGIGPVEVDEELASERAQGGGQAAGGGAEGGGGGERGARCVWRAQAHDGAINCIAAHEEFLATASSDGTVKVWRWADAEEGEGESSSSMLVVSHALRAHSYSALACDFGAAGSVLLSAGLDGVACLWDVPSGVQVVSLSAGRGAVRDARLSRQRAPRALLATDEGLAPLWLPADADPQPARVYAGLAQAATCCAWAGDARLCAVGGAGGELRLLAPPRVSALHHDADAHDLGVTSCDFAPPTATFDLPEDGYLLATAGNDSLIKLWTIEFREEALSARVRLAVSVRAHGGAVASVRWGRAELLASAGDDRWARAWRVGRGEGEGAGWRVRAAGAARVESAGGALCALPVREALLAVGALSGELALWRLPPAPDEADRDGEDEDVEAAPRFWREAGVARWLRDHVTRAPGGEVSRAREAALLEAARAARMSGARLLDEPLSDLVASLGYGEVERATEGAEPTPERTVRARIEDELTWLRDDPPPADVEARAPHALLCPLSHRLLRWPTRAADGFTYERDNILEWLLAAPPEGATSPVSGRRLRNKHLAPNYKLLQAVRCFLREQALDREAYQRTEGTDLK